MTAAPSHIVVVVDENQSYQDIIGNPLAPFVNSLASGGLVAASYNAITHPSQPNYLALFSGSTQGVADDGAYLFSTPNLASELGQAGLTFAGYTETGAASYHSPWLSFANSQSLDANFSQFPTNFNQLPTVAFVDPSLAHDMTDDTGLTEAQAVSQGDQFLSSALGAYAQWAVNNNSLLILTFDEDDGTDNNHIVTIVYGAGVTPGTMTYQQLDHYSLLRTIENFYGFPRWGKVRPRSR